MSLSKLPRELILAISDDLPVSSLSSLLRTCHSLHQLLLQSLTTRITTENRASAVLKRGIILEHLPTVLLALAHEADWHTFNDYRRCTSALELACESNRLDIVAAVLTHFGPTIHDSHTADGSYCHQNELEVAIRVNNVGLATLHGASANRVVWYGALDSDKSPLDLAAKYGSSKIAEALLKYGADVVVAHHSLQYAVETGRWVVATVLLLNNSRIWEPAFPWRESCPVGKRTIEQVEGWVEGGIRDMEDCNSEEMTWMERL